MSTLRAYAKINLGLRILERREDGYHNLETVFHRIDLFDEVVLEPAESLTLRCIPPGLPTDERNLCFRAARILAGTLRRPPGAAITLRKCIPEGAGLGGGSADAAATLLGLVRIWNASITSDRLCTLALELGSDVPYFLEAGTAHATGRGEVLDYFPLDMPYWIVVVFPGLPVSTAWAYGKLAEGRQTSAQAPGARTGVSFKELIKHEIAHPEKLAAVLRNDFQPLVEKAHPVIAETRKSLIDSGAILGGLSGSGSSLFALFEHEKTARAAAKLFQGRFLVSITPPYFEPDLFPSGIRPSGV